MSHRFSVAAHWDGDFDEAGLQKWAEKLRANLATPKVSLGLVFMAPRFFDKAREVLEILRVHGQASVLAGCSSQWLINGGEEMEHHPGISLGLYYLPGAKIDPFYFKQENLEEANGPAYWHVESGIDPSQTNGWLVFIDPFNADSDSWMRQWNEAYPGIPVLGGLASGDFSQRATQVYLNGDVYEEGAVALSISGDVQLSGVISQGCTPIGDTWTITKVQDNLILEIGNRPAYEILLETFSRLNPDEQKKAQGNLFIGLVVNEYLDEFHRGDFLVRNLLGVDPNSGIIAVGAHPRAGQTLQFQRRDATAANEDMIAMLDHAHNRLKGSEILGACLCSCNGRGSSLFGYPHHDAGMVQKRFGPIGLAGFFCNGEIGPVGAKNFLHGYTASLALFVKKAK
jgi:small ligand-binding sensory domain FIST